MIKYKKKDFPVSEVRKILEPSPTVLVSSIWKNKSNIMTMNWYTPMEFTPSLVGCIISNANFSFEFIRKSKECVINVPTVDMIKQVIDIGNTSGADDIDKFKKFKLTPTPAEIVAAPLIKECYANFECRIADSTLIQKYNFFIFEVVKAHVAVSPKFPKTIHYRGDGNFMVSGKSVNHRKRFNPVNL